MTNDKLGMRLCDRSVNGRVIFRVEVVLTRHLMSDVAAACAVAIIGLPWQVSQQ